MTQRIIKIDKCSSCPHASGQAFWHCNHPDKTGDQESRRLPMGCLHGPIPDEFCPLEEAPRKRHPEDSMIKIEGEVFRCPVDNCGCNVFHRFEDDMETYICNACGSTFGDGE